MREKRGKPVIITSSRMRQGGIVFLCFKKTGSTSYIYIMWIHIFVFITVRVVAVVFHSQGLWGILVIRETPQLDLTSSEAGKKRTKCSAGEEERMERHQHQHQKRNQIAEQCVCCVSVLSNGEKKAGRRFKSLPGFVVVVSCVFSCGIPINLNNNEPFPFLLLSLTSPHFTRYTQTMQAKKWWDVCVSQQDRIKSEKEKVFVFSTLWFMSSRQTHRAHTVCVDEREGKVGGKEMLWIRTRNTSLSIHWLGVRVESFCLWQKFPSGSR